MLHPDMLLDVPGTILILGVLSFSIVIGGLAGRWWAISIPLVLVAVFYRGLLSGWWGHGVGEAWYVPMLLGFFIGFIGVWIGISARKMFDERIGT